MANIDGITGVSDATALQAQQGVTYGGQELGKDAFMSLLTTQMQNQDPLDPMKNEDFVAQLASFSSLEQLMGMSGVMQNVALGITSLNNASMASLVGKEVVALADGFHYAGEGSQQIHYEFPEDVSDVRIDIKNSDGKVVHSMELDKVDAGEHSYTWDGKDIDMGQAPEGDYTVNVVGVDASGNDVTATTTLHGLVTEMDYSSGTPQPSVDGTVVSLGDLLKLTTPEEPEEGS